MVVIKRGVCWLVIGLLTGTATTLRCIFVEKEHVGGDWRPVPTWQPLPIYSTGAFSMFRLPHRFGRRGHDDAGPPRPPTQHYDLVLHGHSECVIRTCNDRRDLALPTDSCTGHRLDFARSDSRDLLRDHASGSKCCATRRKKWLRASCRDGHVGNPILCSVPHKFIFERLCHLGSSCGFSNGGSYSPCPCPEAMFGRRRPETLVIFVPASVLALELGPCLLLLGSDMATLEFWLLLVCQEADLVLKIRVSMMSFTLYVVVCASVHRPVSEEETDEMNEQREVIAPCDNLGETLSPLVVLAALMLEGVFDRLPIGRAPYLAASDEGILGGWRHRRFRGEAPIIMIVVLAVRVAFCYIEVALRARQRHRTETGAVAARGRRPSMAVLYDRVVRSRDAPVHMRCAAGGLLAMKSLLFVYLAAQQGKG